MIEIINLNKEINSKEILKNITLNIKKGEIFGIVGSNGCGKTTLLNHIIGIYKPDSGHLKLDGQEFDLSNNFRSKFYYIQDYIYFPAKKTLKDEIKNDSILYPNFSFEKYNQLIEYFKFNDNVNLGTLSKGQKKIAAFIMAVSANPEIYVLDELIDGLDIIIKKKIWNIIFNEILETNATFIISSHDLGELNNTCNSVAFLHEGRVVVENELEVEKEKTRRIQFSTTTPFEEEDNKEYIIHSKKTYGSVTNIVISGNFNTFEQYLHNNYEVVLYEVFQVSLEDLFITELGGVGYEYEDTFIK